MKLNLEHRLPSNYWGLGGMGGGRSKQQKDMERNGNPQKGS